ncbi:metallophosphoesterase [Vagococcus intermedius]|uniref:Metallophosphoesterase n=1 Tax=Vagococcus intermedius TaxID=2991418 RepID=A0AAF0CTN2_9ENTE|nr:metallophosphoesterase [Vagococcus intermedius]WEG72760.1 metallophosphoesterase [Vagococcus intermedius]WEG74846.1 metallophosphoesterase [Vagococcus intermedius]
MFIILSLLILLLSFCLYGYWTNRQLEIESLPLPLTSLPAELDGLKITHLSDIHLKRLRVDKEFLLKEIRLVKPDLIFITGDTIDRTEDLATTTIQQFINDIAVIAPTYVIEGNHEPTCSDFNYWRELLSQSSATLLENDYETIYINQHKIGIIGLKNNVTSLNKKRQESLPNHTINLLLAHHPEHFHEYLTNFDEKDNVIAIFSGHAHGGQIRLPLIDGLLSPNQGWFPRYTNGLYQEVTRSTTYLIVSRGLSNSRFPFRINNKPHLINVILTKKNKP